MKVLIIGGAGEEGSSVAKDLLKFYPDKVSHIVLGDKNEAAAKRVIAEIGGNKVSSRVMDISDHKRMVKDMADVDMVMNYVGPFFRWGPRVLKAAIEAKRNYIDIDDDSESTLKKLDLDDEARAAGITAIVGLGSGPGSDNLLARHGAEKLDRADEINIYWVCSLRAASNSRVVTPAAFRHVHRGIETAGPQYMDGAFVNPAPLSGATWVDFNPPVGRAEVVYFGHPEAVTLPRYIPGLKRCTNKGGVIPGFEMRRLREAHDLGLTRDEPVDVLGHQISPIDFAVALENTFVPDECLGEAISGIRIEIKGVKDGQPKEIVYQDSTSSLSGATAAPASIGLLMLYDGDIKKKGVFAPEGCIDDFKKFMTELNKREF